MLARLRYLALVLTLSVLLTFYLTLLATAPVNQVARGAANPKSRTKEVVAYSLRKQIEIESEEVSCEEVVGEGAFSDAEEGQLWTAVPKTNLFVFGVYYDDRLEPFRYIRLLGMIKGNWNKTLYCQIHVENNSYHITKAVRTEIWLKEWHEGGEDTFNPVLISCLLPSSSKITKLSISASPCKLNPKTFKIATLNSQEAKVNFSPKKYFMTVCVKPLNFAKDISNRLMQWIEMNKILGAAKFEVFVQKVPGKVRHLLEFYSSRHKGAFSVRSYENVEDFFVEKLGGNGFQEQKEAYHGGGTLITRQAVKTHNKTALQEESGNPNKPQPTARSGNHGRSGSVKKDRQDRLQTPAKTKDVGTVNYTEASERKIWQKRRNELIAYNDCLYRNLRSSHFVIPVDIDEIIVPKRFYTWGDALGRLFASAPRLLEDFASFSARNAYFFEELSTARPPEPAFFFEYDTRTQFSEEDESGKSFVSTKNSLTVFNHYSLDALKPGIGRTFFLPLQLVQMNHYKRTCPINLLPQCAKYLSSPVRIVDTVISRYKAEFVDNYERIVKEFVDFSSRQTNKTVT